MDTKLETDPPELGRLRDTRMLWRLTTWGIFAVIALAGAVMIAQTDVGAQRLQLAFAPQTPALSLAQAEIAPQTVASADVKKETETLRLETVRLRTEVRQLADDRDRLNARIAGLEHNLNDMTGSIRRELSVIAATTPQTPAPVIGRPETIPPRSDVATAGDDRPPPADAGRKQDKSQVRFERRVDTRPQTETKTDTRSEAAPDAKAEAQAKPTDAKPEAKAEQTAPPPASSPVIQSVPLPPVRVASAPINSPAGKPEIGIELGGARSMEILNARWAAVKANFGPFIDGMHPLVVHDTRPGTHIAYRLIVGPLPNGAAAAQLCQRFAASRVSCRTTRFAGEPLAQP
jgi:hypothetical protein